MPRKVYVVAKMTPSVPAAAQAAGATEIAVGLPPAVRAVVGNVALPYLYTEADPPARTVEDDLQMVAIPAKVLAALVRAVGVLIQNTAAGSRPPPWVNQTVAAANARLDSVINGRHPNGQE